jgi:hypothetical protein
MKTKDLRTTALIVAAILAAAFVLGDWRVTRQTAALLELDQALAVTRLQLEESRTRLAESEMKRTVLHALDAQVSRQLADQPGMHPMSVMHTAKRGFNDIQSHVAKGEFSGLALTEGYMELKKLFDNPAFEELLANDHNLLSRPAP